MVSVRIYVEGGGKNHDTLARCRQGFHGFFGKFVSAGRQPKVIACGDRGTTFDRFRTALSEYQDAFVILLVDSERSIAPGVAPWMHLKMRDGWDQPAGATDDQAHLMVQCMEAWFLADKDVVADYYGEGFNPNTLPGQQDIEQIDKGDVVRALENATRNTRTKGQYHKTRHGFELLARIDPAKVRQSSRHADHLCQVLLQQTAG